MQDVTLGSERLWGVDLEGAHWTLIATDTGLAILDSEQLVVAPGIKAVLEFVNSTPAEFDNGITVRYVKPFGAPHFYSAPSSTETADNLVEMYRSMGEERPPMEHKDFWWACEMLLIEWHLVR